MVTRINQVLRTIVTVLILKLKVSLDEVLKYIFKHLICFRKTINLRYVGEFLTLRYISILETDLIIFIFVDQISFKKCVYSRFFGTQFAWVGKAN